MTARGLTPDQCYQAVRAFKASGTSRPPSCVKQAAVLGCGRRSIESLYSSMERYEARKGRELCDSLRLRGQIEADGSCLRTMRIAKTNQKFREHIAAWKQSHPRKALPPYFLLYIRVLGLSQRGSNKFIVAPAEPKLVPAAAKPPAESKQEILSSNLLKKVCKRSEIYADGARGWSATVRQFRNKGLVIRHVSHRKSQWSKKTKVRGKKRLSGTQQLDRLWNHAKKFQKPQSKTKVNGFTNGRIWDRLYQFVWRHNQTDEA